MGWTNTGKRAKPERKPELVIPEGGKPGQILVCTAHGVEWIDRVVSCTFSEANGTWSCDKTFNELKAAYEAGSELIAYVNDLICRLSYCGAAAMTFSLFMSADTTFDGSYALAYASIFENDSVGVYYRDS